jgi:hypothetical protein
MDVPKTILRDIYESKKKRKAIENHANAGRPLREKRAGGSLAPFLMKVREVEADETLRVRTTAAWPKQITSDKGRAHCAVDA